MSRIKWSKELILEKIQELEAQGVNLGGGSYRKLIVLCIVLAVDSLETGPVLARRQVYLYRLTQK